MRNSNNAMTFLLAQYRAIFKRAYFKGLATAVLMTAGLAAGAAQAADWSEDASKPTENVVIAAGSSESFGSKEQWVQDITVNGALSSVATASGDFHFTNSMTVNGTLTVSGGYGIVGTKDKGEDYNKTGDFTGSLKINDGATVSIQKSYVQVKDVTVDGGTITISGAIGNGSGSADGAMLLANGDKHGFGTFTLNDGTIKLQNSSQFGGHTTIINGGNVVFEGDTNTNMAFIRAANSGQQGITVNGGTLKVSDNKFGGIYGPNFTLNGGAITVGTSGTLQIAGDFDKKSEAPASATHRGANITLTKGSITNSGTLILGNDKNSSGSITLNGATITNEGKGYIYATSDINMTDGVIDLKNGFGLAGTTKADSNGLGTGYADLVASGGEIKVAKSDLVMLDITLGGDVKVTLTGSDDGKWHANSHIDAAVEDELGGTFTVQDNATITMNDGSLLTGKVFNLKGGHIVMQASGTGLNDVTSGSAAMFRNSSGGQINFAGTEIDVVSDKAGVVRGPDINLTASNIDNQGTLTFAGYISNADSTPINTVSAATDFDMTGGTLTNATGATLNFGVTGVDNKSSTFTIAGGTFSNAGTANVASGSTLTFTGTSATSNKYSNSGTIEIQSGASFTTAGSFTLDGAGKLDFQSGATGISLAGENVVLNNTLAIADKVNVAVEGKVTFNGDGKGGSGNTVDIIGSGDVTIGSTGTLIINDAANTIGLTYNAGTSGALGTFSGDTNFAGIASSSSGILYLDVKGTSLSGTTISNEDLDTFSSNLKQVLTGDSGAGLTIKLEGVTFDYSGAIDENNSASFEKVENALATGVSDGQLENASIKVTSSTSQVQGSVGQIALDSSAGSSVTVGTKTPLILDGYEDKSGNSQGTALVTVGSGDTATVGGAILQTGSQLNVTATQGTIGSVTAKDDGNGTFAVQAGAEVTVVGSNVTANSVKDGVSADTARGDIGDSSKKLNSVDVAGGLNAQNVYTKNLNLTSDTAQMVVEKKVVADTATIKAGTLKAADVAVTTTLNTEAGSALEVTSLTGETLTLAGSTTAESIEARTALSFGGAKATHTVESISALGSLVVDEGTSVVAGDITAAQGLSVVGNAALKVDSLDVSGDLFVGSSAEQGTGGTLSALFIDLNGNDLVVDPNFGENASLVAVGQISDQKSDTDAKVNGSLYALRNAIIALGTDDEQLVKNTFASYLGYKDNANSLDPNNVGALAYIHTAQTIASGHKIVVDKNGTDKTLGNSNYDHNISLGQNSVLAINVDAAKNGAALTFVDSDAKISAADSSSKVVLAGEYNVTDKLNLFADGDTTAGKQGITVVGQDLTIETLNGLLSTTIEAGQDVSTIDIDKMEVKHEATAQMYTDTSSAVRHSVLAYVTGDTQWDSTKKHERAMTRIHGAAAEGFIYDGSAFYRTSDGTTPEGNALTDDEVKKLRLTYVKYVVEDEETRATHNEYKAYYVADNDFLQALSDSGTKSGAAADAAAHMADFGGVAQVALKAGASTYEAISGRMGMGAAQGNLTFANNGQGAGIWVTPIYQSSDSDGFEAQGVSYGADISLYGVALGGDYTLANGVRVGALFNVGSGDADGQGAGSAVSSDFDYYGFGLYAGYSFGQFSVVGDVSYTVVDNDVEANTSLDKLKTSLDAANLSFGVTGAYAFESAAGISVTPHVGLRYSYLDLDDYTVEGSATGTVGSYDSDGLSVFSIPVGVTIASEFKTGSWSVKPSFDLTLTGNFGDDENEGTFKWAGVENIDSAITSEVFDNFTYGATLGIAAQSEAGIALGLTVGYTGSSNVDDLSVGANARFTF